MKMGLQSLLEGTLGYHRANLPFPKITAPTVSPTAPKEYMGLSYNLPEKIHKVTNLVNDTNDAEDSEEESNNDITEDDEEEEELTAAQKNDFVNLIGDKMVVKIIAEDGEYEDALMDIYVQNELNQQQLAEEAIASDALPANRKFIQHKLAWLVPNVDGRESTLQAFKLQTSNIGPCVDTFPNA
jgi:hypothetical protein